MTSPSEFIASLVVAIYYCQYQVYIFNLIPWENISGQFICNYGYYFEHSVSLRMQPIITILF